MVRKAKNRKIPSFFPISIVEVLVLQKFPYGQNSTFFYFAAGKLIKAQIGDIVKIPWRNGEKEGVVVKTKRIVLSNPSMGNKMWKVNLSSLVPKQYFYSPIPQKPIPIKPVLEILEKNYFSRSFLTKLKTAADKNYVSWNHFIKSACYLPPKRKSAVKTNIIPVMGKWVKLLKKEYEGFKDIQVGQLDVKKDFLFLSDSDNRSLQTIVKHVINQKKQVLVLVPEKTQVLPIAAKYSVLSNPFATASPVILGKFLPSSLFRTNWQLSRTLDKGIFVGTRSSVFAPFKDLGLVILEEGHDASYKEWDRMPRYDLRLLLPDLYPNPVIKTYISSTPRFQDFLNSPQYILKKKGKLTVSQYRIEKLPDKEVLDDPRNSAPSNCIFKLNYQGEKKKVCVVNMGVEKRMANIDLMGEFLGKSLKKVLTQKKWGVLLANHKGWASVMLCKECGYIPYCPSCNYPLTVNAESGLFCSFCGFNQKDFNSCPKCKGVNFHYRGMGIERAREILLEFEKKLGSILITSPGPKSNFNDLCSFWNNLAAKKKPLIFLGYAGILPIARLLKRKIGLSAILSFDSFLFHPDFRGEEKAASRFYSLLSIAPKAIVQTYNPNHRLIQKMARSTYSSFFYQWKKERKDFKYPPFSTLVKIELRDNSFQKAKEEAEKISRIIQSDKAVIETVATPSSVSKRRNEYFWCVVVKIKKGSGLDKKTVMKLPRDAKIDVEPEVLV